MCKYVDYAREIFHITFDSMCLLLGIYLKYSQAPRNYTYNDICCINLFSQYFLRCSVCHLVPLTEYKMVNDNLYLNANHFNYILMKSFM